ncbi:rhodanese-like domain-containing protein [Nocardia halotolerans]|uniref:Rhodanese-like domain-containing protein n=1 Tax=Nocardia halotolerans TaxID=1755878 RepID=A0ABV8VPE9_9NOCA
MSRSAIDQMLDNARAKLRRLYVYDVPAALARGAILVDIRPAAQRVREGSLPGALVIERNVLEWRLDPTSSARLSLAVDQDVEWIIFCSEGYTSSLAAAALQELGLRRATDLIGGYQAVKSAGMLTMGVGVPHFARELESLASL